MKAKKIDFIHVGDYKTGTTWLQRSVLPFHPEIQYLGDNFENIKLKEVLGELVDVRDLDFDANKLREKFTQNLVRQENKICGFSREALSQSDYITGENAKRNAQRLKEVFGDVKIIYVIREQISMLSSIYSQYLKGGGTRRFKDWFLDPIECKGIIERLKYDKNIQMYQEIFGKENVLVLLYEELQDNRENFLGKFFNFIGCNDCKFMPERGKESINLSLTNIGASISRLFQKLFRTHYHNYRSAFLNLDKVIYTLLPNKIINKIDSENRVFLIPNYQELDSRQRVLFSINSMMSARLTSYFEKIRIGRKLEVPKDISQKILPLFKESNARLLREFNLEVDKFGWFH